MKKRLFILAILLTVTLVFAACSGKNDKKDSEKTENTETETETEESKKETIEESTEEAKDDSEETTEDNADTTNISEEAGKEGDIMGNTLLYQGHASARIVTTEGKVIYIDPYAGEGYDLPADLILVTHDHYDHTGIDKISGINPDCYIITWKEALVGEKYQSFDLGYVEVEAVEAGYNPNHNVSSCVGYILTFSNGVSVYFTGDTSTTPQMSELASRNLDYAFICCDGVYNMGLEEAAECANTINAKHNIPYHIAPGADFDMDKAKAFDAPNKLIVEAGEEIVLE